MTVFQNFVLNDAFLTYQSWETAFLIVNHEKLPTGTSAESSVGQASPTVSVSYYWRFALHTGEHHVSIRGCVSNKRKVSA